MFNFITLRIPYIFNYIYILCRQMYTVLCYLTQFLLNAAQHVSSLYKAHLQGHLNITSLKFQRSIFRVT
jgi:hypothetical protein